MDLARRLKRKKPFELSEEHSIARVMELSSNGASKKSKSKAKHDSKQWEEWQKKDDEYINENFEQDLQSAIMQSRLDYENHKKNYAPDITSKGQEKPSKKKKTKTMSLDQFLEKDKSPTSKTGLFMPLISSSRLVIPDVMFLTLT
uniref:G kinase-anchoring protein 1-like n=1 Tax=Diabrotica virgifera virgifera TaxID=50390 RepID=A0A6P7G6A0_DIAVI